VGAVVVATFLWGGTFVAIRDSVAAIPPAALVTGRFACAGVLFAIGLAVRRRLPTARAVLGGAISGVLMAAEFYFQARGLESTSAGSSAFLTCAGSLLAAFWAWLLLRQRPSGRLLLGLALALVGSALLSLRQGLVLGAGEAWTLLGALLFGLQVVALAPFARTADPIAIVCVQSFVAAAILLPFAGSPASVWSAIAGAGRGDPAALFRFGYLAVAGSTVAPLLQVLAQRVLPPGRIGLLFALEPVFALLFALTIGREQFTPRWWLGSALILAAVLFVEWRTSDE
jgi:drug/metabolite transporter (DMT)-like permease